MSYFKLGSLFKGLSTTATAAGTTTLVASSKQYQQFTGTTTQTVVLPDATTLSNGRRFDVFNRSTGIVTVNFNGGALAATVPADSQRYFFLTSNGSAAGSWVVGGVVSGGSSATVSSADKLNLLSGMAGIQASTDSIESRLLKYNPEEMGGDYFISLAALPSARANTSNFSLNGFLYVAGGWAVSALASGPTVRFDADNNYWLSRANIGTANYTSPGIATSFGYIFGGTNGSDVAVNTVYKYTDTTNLWSSLTAHPLTTGSMSAFKVSGGLYTNGGQTSPYTQSYIYDETANAWYLRSSSPSIHRQAQSFELNDYGYVAGSAVSGHALVDKFTSSTNSWAIIASLITGRRGGTGAATNGMGYAFCGLDSGNSRLSSSEQYSDATTAWKNKASLSVIKANFAECSSDLFGNTYLIGGETSGTSLTSSDKYVGFSLFNLGSLKRSTAVPTSILVSTLTNALANNLPVQIRTSGNEWKTFTSGLDSALKTGETLPVKFTESHEMMACGGGSPQVATTEIHNPITIAWTTKASMITARGGGWHFPIDGYGYAGGGGAGPNTANERYNVLANTWASRTAAPAGRDRTQSHVLNGFGYVYSTSGSFTNNQLKYNATLDSWSIPASTYSPANGYALGYALLGHGYIIGGELGGPTGTANHQYSDVLDTFTAKAVVHNVQQGGCVAFEGFGYVIGGYNGSDISTVSSYNSGTNAWVAKTSLATAQSSNSSDFEDGGIYSVSGNVSPTSNFKLNPYSNVWSASLTALNASRIFPIMNMPGFYRNYEVRVGIPAFYAGVGDGIWTSAASNSAALNFGQGLNIAGQGYAINGFLGGGSQTSRVEKYDEPLDVWISSVPNSNALYSPLCFELESRGHRASGQVAGGPHEAFSPIVGAWVTLTSGPGAADYGQGSTLNGRGYALGASGPSTSQYYLNSTNAWTATTSPGNGFQTSRWSQGGFIYLAGADAPSTATQKFNDATAVWVASASMITARRNPAFLYNGMGVMAGSITSYIASAEAYIDSGNYWKTISSMTTGVGGQATFALQNSGYAAMGYNGSPLTTNQRLSSSVKSAVLGLALEVK